MYIERRNRCIHTELVLAGTNELHNYSLENRFFFFRSLSLPHPCTPLNAFAFEPSRCCCLLQMYLLKEFCVFFFFMFSCPKRTPCVWNRLSVGLKVHTRRSIDFLGKRARLNRTREKSASRTHLNFAPFCKSSLLIERFFFCLHQQSWFFSAFSSLKRFMRGEEIPLLCLCGGVPRECMCATIASVHTWKEGEKKKLSEN